MSNNTEGKSKPFCSRAKYWLTTLLFFLSVQLFAAEPEVWEATLKLGGQSCDVNAAESAVLRLKGVVMVDVESRKGYLIVGYDPTRVSPDMMLGAVGKKRGKEKSGKEKNGKDWFCSATVVGIGRQ